MRPSLAAVLLAAALAACVDDPSIDPDAGSTDPMVDASDPEAPDAEGDVTPPVTVITEAPANPSASADASFAFTSYRDSTFECRLDAAAFAACTSPHAVTVADGAHTFEVRAIDAAGNVDGSPATHAWVTDTVAPTTTITEAPAALDNSTTVAFAFAADEDAAFACALDGAALAPCTSPHVATVADGAHTFLVRATDAAGNVDPSPATHAWTLDSSTPDTTIETGPTGAVASLAATFGFASPDAGAGASFECRLDGAAFAACTSPRELTDLAQGTHTFEVRVRDAAGNVDPMPAARTWTVDTIAPDTTVASGPQGPTASNDPVFQFASEPGAAFRCRLDGGDDAACASPHAFADVADGAHVVSVYACDAAGNCDATPATRAFTVDTVAPQTTFGPGGPTSPNPSNDALMFFSSSEPGGTFQCRLGNAAYFACSSPWTLLNVPDGNRRFYVYACDAAGNCDPTPAQHNWTVDTTPPETEFTHDAPELTASTSVNFGFVGASGGTYWCRLDQGAWVECEFGHGYTGLADGTHVFEVYACDPAGNCDATPAVSTWVINTTPTETTLLSGPDGVTSDSTPTFTFSGESFVTPRFACSVDGGWPESCQSPHTVAALADGPHTFTVYACGLSCDATPETRTFTVDTP